MTHFQKRPLFLILLGLLAQYTEAQAGCGTWFKKSLDQWLFKGRARTSGEQGLKLLNNKYLDDLIKRPSTRLSKREKAQVQVLLRDIDSLVRNSPLVVMSVSQPEKALELTLKRLHELDERFVQLLQYLNLEPSESIDFLQVYLNERGLAGVKGLHANEVVLDGRIGEVLGPIKMELADKNMKNHFLTAWNSSIPEKSLGLLFETYAKGLINKHIFDDMLEKSTLLPSKTGYFLRKNTAHLTDKIQKRKLEPSSADLLNAKPENHSGSVRNQQNKVFKEVELQRVQQWFLNRGPKKSAEAISSVFSILGRFPGGSIDLTELSAVAAVNIRKFSDQLDSLILSSHLSNQELHEQLAEYLNGPLKHLSPTALKIKNSDDLISQGSAMAIAFEIDDLLKAKEVSRGLRETTSAQAWKARYFEFGQLAYFQKLLLEVSRRLERVPKPPSDSTGFIKGPVKGTYRLLELKVNRKPADP